MSVTLLRPYAGYAIGTVVTFSDITESSLITQGLAVASLVTSVPATTFGQIQQVTQAGNQAIGVMGGQAAFTANNLQGPAIQPNMPMGGVALTAAGASSAHVAGTMNLAEIFLPNWNTWKGMAVLNGTIVGTDNMLVALYGSNGTLLANSAVAGALSAGASVFQNRDFLTPVTLPPGRYFCGVQCAGTTATTMKFIAANGVNVLTAAPTGTFGVVPTTVAVPTTNTTAVGCVVQLYT